MKIETYEQEQQINEIGQLAADGEYAILVEQLGLTGQKTFLDDDGSPSVPVFPYPRLTEEQKRVFEYHCPLKTKLKEYRSEVIPVRVLQVASHAESCRFLKTLWVWHPKYANLDPVLIGTTGTYDSEPYLLARWGAVWKDFAQLKEEAIQGWKLLRMTKLAEAKREIEDCERKLESESMMYFNGEHISSSVYF
jgi:hypothetical protein